MQSNNVRRTNTLALIGNPNSSEHGEHDSKVASLDLKFNEHSRRTRLVSFRCNKCGEDGASYSTHHLQIASTRELTFTAQNICLTHRRLLLRAGERTERLVNPLAWDRGLVFMQCSGCQVWHQLADAANLIEEIRFVDE